MFKKQTILGMDGIAPNLLYKLINKDILVDKTSASINHPSWNNANYNISCESEWMKWLPVSQDLILLNSIQDVVMLS